MLQCPKCSGHLSENGALCTECGFIVDSSFVEHRFGYEATRISKGLDTHAISSMSQSVFGRDALIVGHSHHGSKPIDARDTGLLQTTVTSARLFVGEDIQEFLQPNLIPRKREKRLEKAFNVSPFEAHLLQWVNGHRPIALIQRKAGLDEESFQIAISLLADKGYIEKAGFVDQERLERARKRRKNRLREGPLEQHESNAERTLIAKSPSRSTEAHTRLDPPRSTSASSEDETGTFLKSDRSGHTVDQTVVTSPPPSGARTKNAPRSQEPSALQTSEGSDSGSISKDSHQDTAAPDELKPRSAQRTEQTTDASELNGDWIYTERTLIKENPLDDLSADLPTSPSALNPFESERAESVRPALTPTQNEERTSSLSPSSEESHGPVARADASREQLMENERGKNVQSTDALIQDDSSVSSAETEAGLPGDHQTSGDLATQAEVPHPSEFSGTSSHSAHGEINPGEGSGHGTNESGLSASPAVGPETATPLPAALENFDADRYARCRKAEKIFEQAEKDFKDKNFSSAAMNAKLASIYNPEEERYTAAYEEWSQLKVENDHDAEHRKDVMLYRNAVRAEEKGAYEQAVRFLEKALEISPRAAALHNRVGVLKAIQLKDSSGGMEHMLQACDLDPGNLAYKNNLGKIMAILEEKRESKKRTWKFLNDDSDEMVRIKKIRPKFY